MTNKEIKELAFEWAVDYKPWETDLSPQEYAEYGFEMGFLRALKEIQRGMFDHFDKGES